MRTTQIIVRGEDDELSVKEVGGGYESFVLYERDATPPDEDTRIDVLGRQTLTSSVSLSWVNDHTTSAPGIDLALLTISADTFDGDEAYITISGEAGMLVLVPIFGSVSTQRLKIVRHISSTTVHVEIPYNASVTTFTDLDAIAYEARYLLDGYIDDDSAPGVFAGLFHTRRFSYRLADPLFTSEWTDTLGLQIITENRLLPHNILSPHTDGSPDSLATTDKSISYEVTSKHLATRTTRIIVRGEDDELSVKEAGGGYESFVLFERGTTPPDEDTRIDVLGRQTHSVTAAQMALGWVDDPLTSAAGIDLVLLTIASGTFEGDEVYVTISGTAGMEALEPIFGSVSTQRLKIARHISSTSVHVGIPYNASVNLATVSVDSTFYEARYLLDGYIDDDSAPGVFAGLFHTRKFSYRLADPSYSSEWTNTLGLQIITENRLLPHNILSPHTDGSPTSLATVDKSIGYEVVSKRLAMRTTRIIVRGEDDELSIKEVGGGYESFILYARGTTPPEEDPRIDVLGGQTHSVTAAQMALGWVDDPLTSAAGIDLALLTITSGTFEGDEVYVTISGEDGMEELEPIFGSVSTQRLKIARHISTTSAHVEIPYNAAVTLSAASVDSTFYEARYLLDGHTDDDSAPGVFAGLFHTRRFSYRLADPSFTSEWNQTLGLQIITENRLLPYNILSPHTDGSPASLATVDKSIGYEVVSKRLAMRTTRIIVRGEDDELSVKEVGGGYESFILFERDTAPPDEDHRIDVLGRQTHSVTDSQTALAWVDDPLTSAAGINLALFTISTGTFEGDESYIVISGASAMTALVPIFGSVSTQRLKIARHISSTSAHVEIPYNASVDLTTVEPAATIHEARYLLDGHIDDDAAPGVLSGLFHTRRFSYSLADPSFTSSWDDSLGLQVITENRLLPYNILSPHTDGSPTSLATADKSIKYEVTSKHLTMRTKRTLVRGEDDELSVREVGGGYESFVLYESDAIPPDEDTRIDVLGRQTLISSVSLSWVDDPLTSSPGIDLALLTISTGAFEGDEVYISISGTAGMLVLVPIFGSVSTQRLKIARHISSTTVHVEIPYNASVTTFTDLDAIAYKARYLLDGYIDDDSAPGVFAGLFHTRKFSYRLADPSYTSEWGGTLGLQVITERRLLPHNVLSPHTDGSPTSLATDEKSISYEIESKNLTMRTTRTLVRGEDDELSVKEVAGGYESFVIYERGTDAPYGDTRINVLGRPTHEALTPSAVSMDWVGATGLATFTIGSGSVGDATYLEFEGAEVYFTISGSGMTALAPIFGSSTSELVQIVRHISPTTIQFEIPYSAAVTLSAVSVDATINDALYLLDGHRDDDSAPGAFAGLFHTRTFFYRLAEPSYTSEWDDSLGLEILTEKRLLPYSVSRLVDGTPTALATEEKQTSYEMVSRNLTMRTLRKVITGAGPTQNGITWKTKTRITVPAICTGVDVPYCWAYASAADDEGSVRQDFSHAWAITKSTINAHEVGVTANHLRHIVPQSEVSALVAAIGDPFSFQTQTYSFGVPGWFSFSGANVGTGAAVRVGSVGPVLLPRGRLRVRNNFKPPSQAGSDSNEDDTYQQEGAGSYATATVTITDFTELNSTDKVNLIATDGTDYDFTNGSQSYVAGTWESATSNNQTATNLMSVINTGSGPSGTRFTASVDGAVVTIKQATSGPAGNTAVTLTDTGTAGMSKTDFIGGAPWSEAGDGLKPGQSTVLRGQRVSWGGGVVWDVKVQKARWGYWMVDVTTIILPKEPKSNRMRFITSL